MASLMEPDPLAIVTTASCTPEIGRRRVVVTFAGISCSTVAVVVQESCFQWIATELD